MAEENEGLVDLIKKEGLAGGLRHAFLRFRYEHPRFDGFWARYGINEGFSSTHINRHYVVEYDSEGRVSLLGPTTQYLSLPPRKA